MIVPSNNRGEKLLASSSCRCGNSRDESTRFVCVHRSAYGVPIGRRSYGIPNFLLKFHQTVDLKTSETISQISLTVKRRWSSRTSASSHTTFLSEMRGRLLSGCSSRTLARPVEHFLHHFLTFSTSVWAVFQRSVAGEIQRVKFHWSANI